LPETGEDLLVAIRTFNGGSGALWLDGIATE
jgi:hypothetical protein